MHFFSFVLGYTLLLVLSLSQLAQARGSFFRSCLPGLLLERGHFLKAYCGDGLGNILGSEVNLNDCIGIGEKGLIYQLKYAESNSLLRC